jgi:hypothetical protein
MVHYKLLRMFKRTRFILLDIFAMPPRLRASPRHGGARMFFLDFSH